MRRSIGLVLLLLGTPASVLAQPAAEPNSVPPPSEQPPGQPPPPPIAVPPPPVEGQLSAGAPAAAPQPAEPGGQWVYTRQFGWLWMPHGQQYTYVPGDPQVYPDQYVYYPAYGWRWVVAPWVYGYGPAPYWGVWGPRYFAWYSRPWFRVGGHWGWGGYRGWGQYRGWIGPRAWGAHGWARAPAYYRSGVGHLHAAGARPAGGHAAHPAGGGHGGGHRH